MAYTCRSALRLTVNLLIVNKENDLNGEFRLPPRRGRMRFHTEDRFGPGARPGPFCFQEHGR